MRVFKFAAFRSENDSIGCDTDVRIAWKVNLATQMCTTCKLACLKPTVFQIFVSFMLNSTYIYICTKLLPSIYDTPTEKNRLERQLRPFPFPIFLSTPSLYSLFPSFRSIFHYIKHPCLLFPTQFIPLISPLNIPTPAHQSHTPLIFPLFIDFSRSITTFNLPTFKLPTSC